jgi:hypothetical protein
MTRVCSIAGPTLFLIALVIVVTGCARITDPEDSGGEIIAIPEGPWCDFNLSADGAWLQYVGDYSAYHPTDQPSVAHQRQAWFVDLDTGQAEPAIPDAQVAEQLRAGLGPDGLGCFSPEHDRVYYTRAIFTGEPAADTEPDKGYDVQEGLALVAPGRSVQRLHYRVDLSESPLTVTLADGVDCIDAVAPVRPEVRVEQDSDKQVRIISPDGTVLGEHRPRGRASRRVSIWDLDAPQWEQSYALSPDQRHLAYRVHETDRIGFSAPTHGYLVDVGRAAEHSARFLAASVYSLKWSARNHLFACTSHRSHGNVIVRWATDD